MYKIGLILCAILNMVLFYVKSFVFKIYNFFKEFVTTVYKNIGLIIKLYSSIMFFLLPFSSIIVWYFIFIKEKIVSDKDLKSMSTFYIIASNILVIIYVAMNLHSNKHILEMIGDTFMLNVVVMYASVIIVLIGKGMFDGSGGVREKFNEFYEKCKNKGDNKNV